ncbi:MAG: CapA family protein [Patescibacteria group bacterium]
MRHSPLQKACTALLVIAFGWGTGYIVLKGIEYFQPSTIIVQTGVQKALTLEAKVVNPAVPETSKLTIMVGGDLMFDRGIRAIGERNGYASLFDDSVVSLFKKADMVVANLEGPITTNVSKTLINGKTTDSFTFTFPIAAADALKSVGIDVVSLANNHTDNFGFAGYQETQAYLRDAGIEWFGNPWNATSTRLTIRTATGDSPVATLLEKNGITIAFVGYHAFQLGVDQVIAEIRRVSKPGVFTIVMPHWGEEYVSVPSDKMRSYARAFIAAGADAVIGAHPHIVAEQEWIGAVPVHYSVGNLLFDQYFSEQVKRGMVVQLDLVKKDGVISIARMATHETSMKPGIGVSLEK